MSRQRHQFLQPHKAEVADGIKAARDALRQMNDTTMLADQLRAQSEQHEAAIKLILDAHTVPEEKAALEWAKELEVLKQVSQLNPTDANSDAIENHNTTRPANWDTLESTISGSVKKAQPAIKGMANARVKLQLLQQPSPFKKQLQDASGDYDLRLSAIEHRLNQATSIKAINQCQKDLSSAHKTYQTAVQDIHKQASTHNALNNISRPLNAIRGKNALNTVAKITPLNPSDYQLNGSETPGALIDLHNQIGKVNSLLKERHNIERIITTHPNLAKMYEADIKANTEALSEAMGSPVNSHSGLVHLVSSLLPEESKSNLLQAHPDVETFMKEAGALYEALGQAKFFQRNKARGQDSRLKRFKRSAINTASIFNPFAKAWNASKQSDFPDVKFSTKAVEDLQKNVTTTYWTHDENNNWTKKTLECELKGKDGKPMLDKDGNPRIETVKFTKQEFESLYAEYTKKHGLTGANAPQRSRKGNIITVKWPTEAKKNGWLDFQRDHFQTKCQKEEAAKPTASVTASRPGTTTAPDPAPDPADAFSASFTTPSP